LLAPWVGLSASIPLPQRVAGPMGTVLSALEAFRNHHQTYDSLKLSFLTREDGVNLFIFGQMNDSVLFISKFSYTWSALHHRFQNTANKHGFLRCDFLSSKVALSQD
jgi:hypothetical protein